MTIRILIADDHCIVREGLCSLIKGYPDFIVAGQAVSGREAVKFTRRLCPEIVIMDISMPDLNVSVKTVEARRTAIMHKLNLHSIAELTKYAIREGLTSVLD